tara:strand:- start:8206 stop:9267 length:1062 start_codon:yes stop_codon:yes gene_type:complete
MLLRNYVIKKLLLTTMAIAGSLAIIFCGFGLSEVMHTIIGGSFGKSIIFKSMLLQMPMLLSLLLPLAIFIAGILVVNNFIASRELIVMQAAGISLYNLNNWILTIALVIAVIVSGSSLYLEAKADKIKNQIFNTINFGEVLNNLKPGNFYPLMNNNGIIHVSNDQQSLFIMFAGDSSKKKASKIIIADKTSSSISSLGSRWGLKDIKYYAFEPGKNSGIMLSAKDGAVTLNEPKNKNLSNNIKYMDVAGLIENTANPEVAAILYWKLSLPLSAIILSLFIIPITSNSFAQQKHLKIIVGIMIYGIYIATSLVVRRYVAIGAISYYLALLLIISSWLAVLVIYYSKNLWLQKCK